jgi:hypothetical protein
VLAGDFVTAASDQIAQSWVEFQVNLDDFNASVAVVDDEFGVRLGANCRQTRGLCPTMRRNIRLKCAWSHKGTSESAPANSKLKPLSVRTASLKSDRTEP